MKTLYICVVLLHLTLHHMPASQYQIQPALLETSIKVQTQTFTLTHPRSCCPTPAQAELNVFHAMLIGH